MKINGIDVSKYQGNINWAKVKAEGIKFALIRVGWCGYDGNITLDKMYQKNMQGAIANGIDVGVYLYSYAKTANSAVIAAKQTLELVKIYNLTYPIYFDIEDNIYQKMSKEQNTLIVKAFLEVIEHAKYYGAIYTYTCFISKLDMNTLSRFDLCIADYRGYNGYQGNCGMWQHSSKGRVNGISGNVDLDIAYKDYPTIIKNAGLNKLQLKPQLPPPNYTNYRVKPNDGFWRIANEQMGSGTKMFKLASFNGLKITSKIFAGNVLKIPK